MLRKLTLLAVALAIMACTSAPSKPEPAPTERVQRGDDGPRMIGLEDPPPVDVWTEWTADASAPTAPVLLGQRFAAFDYWQVADEAFVSQSWNALFPVLDTLRRESAELANVEETLTLLMATVEPGAASKPTGMDITFVVSARPGAEAEGVLVRLFQPLDSGATPGISILLVRQPGGSAAFGEAYIWGTSGFAQGSAFSARVDTESIVLAAGLVYPMAAQKDAGADLSAQLIYEILAEQLWRPLTGMAYLESQLPAEQPIAQPPGFEPAAGLVLGDREVEQVFNDTVFVPRIGDLGFQ